MRVFITTILTTLLKLAALIISFSIKLIAALLTASFRTRQRRRVALAMMLILFILAMSFGIWLRFAGKSSPTESLLGDYLADPKAHPELITDLKAPCPNAPFLLPSRGFVGLLFADPSPPYTVLSRHPGVDVFGDGDQGSIPVYAAYDGYLTRLSGWISSVIIRIPKDPLDPSRQIWTYYTHMASITGDTSYITSEFPEGTSEKFVKQGTLLGYQGLYAGSGRPPIAMHVHFSVVLSSADGSFLNEARFGNTIDPSPYFRLTLNAEGSPQIPVKCNR